MSIGKKYSLPKNKKNKISKPHLWFPKGVVPLQALGGYLKKFLWGGGGGNLKLT